MALELLRDFNLKGQLSLIAKQGNKVNFGGSYVYAASQKTGYKDYTLEVVLYFLVHRGLTWQDYIKQAAANKVPTVALIDRKVSRDIKDLEF